MATVAPQVCLSGSSAVTALGPDLETTAHAILAGRSGLVREDVPGGYSCLVGRIPPVGEGRTAAAGSERFGALSLRSLLAAGAALPPGGDPARSLLILCSAKGNVASLLGGGGSYSLSATAKSLSQQLGYSSTPLSLSLACASGLAGLAQAYRLLRTKQFDRIAVVGCDVLSSFTLLGFQCVKALSADRCRPFHADRDGTSLGEAAATVVLEYRPPHTGETVIAGAGISNDASHVSRPRQDGSGLATSIRRATAGERPAAISLHGTGTRLNDEMEAAALQSLDLSTVPAYAVKAYVGHTLGACGVLETALAAAFMRTGVIPATTPAGGTSAPPNLQSTARTVSYRSCLKTAAGFGGTNVALYLKRSA